MNTNQIKTTQTAPTDLQVGDRVLYYGALLQVEYIHRTQDDNEPVAACISRVIDEQAGSIPKCLFETPECMRQRGCAAWVDTLPEGRYWNVQGNQHARFSKVEN